MSDRPPAFRTFFDDLAHALRAWKLYPLFLIPVVLVESGPNIADQVSLELAGYPECSLTRSGCGLLSVLVPFHSLAFVIVLAGWFGTERIWYLRAFRGETLRREEIWPLTSAFRRRFLALGFFFMLAFIPVFAAGAWLGNATGSAVAFLLFTASLDAAITFATPALAFSTPRALVAIRIGFELTKRTWPGSALYLFIPPLAIRLVAIGLWRGRLTLLVAIALDVLAVLLNFWFKGATARFYLRYNEAGEDGAAFELVKDHGG